MRILIFQGVIFLILCSSCNQIFGLKEQKILNKKEITLEARKRGIPDFELVIIDVSAYKKYLEELKDTILRKHAYQPLQVRVYDKEGKPVLVLVNCFVGGFPNLNWNKYGTFDSYPPASVYFKPDSGSLYYKDELTLFKGINGEILNPDNFEKKDLNIIVFWSRFMNRQSKRLIQTIENYRKKYRDHQIKVTYVNDDNLY
jgi:hypothetical protein